MHSIQESIQTNETVKKGDSCNLKVTIHLTEKRIAAGSHTYTWNYTLLDSLVLGLFISPPLSAASPVPPPLPSLPAVLLAGTPAAGDSST
jgi:hypothetical protein